MKTQKVLYVDEELHAEVKALAAKNKMTLSAFIKQALSNQDRICKCAESCQDEGTPC